MIRETQFSRAVIEVRQQSFNISMNTFLSNQLIKLCESISLINRDTSNSSQIKTNRLCVINLQEFLILSLLLVKKNLQNCFSFSTFPNSSNGKKKRKEKLALSKYARNADIVSSSRDHRMV